MKVAIVHYWLVNMRGGEKVVEALCELFPQADIFTHVYDPSSISPIIKRHAIKTTFIQRLPFAVTKYQSYLPLMPMALEQLDLRDYDLIISSESGPAKGVITRSDALHVCYCHTPMRYVWDMYHDYLKNAGVFTKTFMPPLIHYLRMWDLASASRVDHFVANSAFVAKRIQKHYRREAEVIHPPVSTTEFTISENKEDYYLMVGELVSYKRVDLAVEAFNISGKKLVIIGEGEQTNTIMRLANPNVIILGRQPFSVIKEHYMKAKALIFPGIEDFGIVPVEAMASGTPVIAYRAGGALETVKENETGLFFDQQTPVSLNEAIDRYETMSNMLSSYKIAEHSKIFGEELFKSRFVELINRLHNI